jgi:exodeoxyribonuclease VII large subunit
MAVLAQLRGRLAAAASHGATVARHRLAAGAGRLESLSPLGVLARGYSLTRLPSGAVLRSAGQVRSGDAVEILLHEGVLGARITDVKERDERHRV